MEKQTNREETIKYLKNKKDSEERKVTTTIFILIIASIITLIISRIDSTSTIFPICIIVEILIVIILISNVKKYRVTSSQISLETKTIKREFIERKSRKGNIKEIVSIKDPQIVNTILSKGIDKIVVEKCIVDQWMVQILLKNGCHISTQISGSDFINLLKDNEKQSLLDSIILSIKIQNNQSGSTKIEIETTIPNYSLCKEQSTQDDLLEMFELKNNCYDRRPT